MCFPYLIERYTTSFWVMIWSLCYFCVPNNQPEDCLLPLFHPCFHFHPPRLVVFFFPLKRWYAGTVLSFTFSVILFCPTELVMAQYHTKPLSPCCLKWRSLTWPFRKCNLPLDNSFCFLQHGDTHLLLLSSFHLDINFTTLWQPSKFSFLLLCSAFWFKVGFKEQGRMSFLCIFNYFLYSL